MFLAEPRFPCFFIFLIARSLRQCRCRAVLSQQVLRVIEQTLQPLLFTKFRALNRMAPERNARLSIHCYLTEKKAGKILWMNVLAYLDDFSLCHCSQHGEYATYRECCKGRSFVCQTY